MMGLRGKTGRSKGIVTRDRALGGARQPDPEPTVPEPPVPLSDAAMAHWNRLATALVAAEMLADVDLTALVVCCNALAEVDACEKVLAVEGLTTKHVNKAGAENVVPHPLLKIRNSSRIQAVQLLKAFGMTPAVRGLTGKLPPLACEVKDDDESRRVQEILKRSFFS